MNPVIYSFTHLNFLIVAFKYYVSYTIYFILCIIHYYIYYINLNFSNI